MVADREKVALVTGATGGFGSVLARTLADAGMKVFGTGRQVPVQDAGGAVTLLPMDVTNDDSVAACLQSVLAEADRLDVVINCVNDMFIARTDEQSVAEVDRLYQTNVFGVMRVCQAVLPRFREQGDGMIVNMSSLGGLLAVPYMGAYTSAKHALEAMTEALYHEVREDNVNVVIMQPVAMHMDRGATGSHLRLASGVGDDSFSHRMVAKMAADTAASGLTPEQVADRVLAVTRMARPPLRVPMDRAVALSFVRRLAPQRVIDGLIGGLVKEAGAL